MVTFFDLITFFGVASFFAWLAFAPLQSDQLSKFKGKNRKKAGDNFAAINDYFLVSFLSCALAAICDYLFHNPAYVSYRSALYSGIGLSFLAGIAGLLGAILYVRLIVKGEKTWYNVNPPGFFYTLLVFAWTVGWVYFSAENLISVSHPKAQFVWFSAGCWVAWGGWRMIRYSDEWRWKERGRRKGATGFVLTFVPACVKILMPFLAFA